MSDAHYTPWTANDEWLARVREKAATGDAVAALLLKRLDAAWAALEPKIREVAQEKLTTNAEFGPYTGYETLRIVPSQ
jgi:hypothetical protein